MEKEIMSRITLARGTDLNVQVLRSMEKEALGYLTVIVSLECGWILEKNGLTVDMMAGLDNNTRITFADRWYTDPDGARILLSGDKYKVREWSNNAFTDTTKTVPDHCWVRQTGLGKYSDPFPEGSKATLGYLGCASIKASVDAFQTVLFKNGISTIIMRHSILSEAYPTSGHFVIIVTENRRFAKLTDIFM